MHNITTPAFFGLGDDHCIILLTIPTDNTCPHT